MNSTTIQKDPIFPNKSNYTSFNINSKRFKLMHVDENRNVKTNYLHVFDKRAKKQETGYPLHTTYIYIYIYIYVVLKT